MRGLRKYSIAVMIMALSACVFLFTGCEYSSTHESETTVNVSTEEEADQEEESAVRNAAVEINDYLAEDWPDSFHVTYNDADDEEYPNTVFVHFWSNGITNIENMDELIPEMVEYSDTFSRILEENGVSGGHSIIQLLVDVKDDDSYREGNHVLEVIDGKVTFNAYEE